MTVQIPEDLVDYLAARDRQRNDQITEAIATLTPREQTLVREAAAMGYVQGAMATGGAADSLKIPPGSAILRIVIGACLLVPDLYPHLSAQPARRAKAVGLTREQLAALQTAALGLPRDRAARHLGISERTYRRHLSAAATALGASGGHGHAVALAAAVGLIPITDLQNRTLPEPIKNPDPSRTEQENR